MSEVVTMDEQDVAAALNSGDAADGFSPCCGHPPKVTEWRPGCYGAQCMTCGRIVGAERQLDEDELREAWNRVIANAPHQALRGSGVALNAVVG